MAPRLIETIRRERISVLAAVPRVHGAAEGASGADLSPGWQSRVDRSDSEDRAAAALVALPQDVIAPFGLKFWALISGGGALPGPLEQFWNALGFVRGAGLRDDGDHGADYAEPPLPRGRGNHRQAARRARGEAGAGWRSAGAGRSDLRRNVVGRRAASRARTSGWPPATWPRGEASGELRFLGRKSEVIVTAAGVNMHPEDLEAAIEAAAGRGGLRGGGDGDGGGSGAMRGAGLPRDAGEQAAAAIEDANARLAEFQRLRRWVLWPEPDLPRTSTGKVRRKAVAEWLPEIQSAAATADTHGKWTTEWRVDTVAGLAAGADCADHRRRPPPAWAMSCT